jgi:hypothetical protein
MVKIARVPAPEVVTPRIGDDAAGFSGLLHDGVYVCFRFDDIPDGNRAQPRRSCIRSSFLLKNATAPSSNS